MALTTYAGLVTSIQSWLHRTDLATVVDDFISLAEARMSGDLNSRAMEAKLSLTATAGVRTVAVPSGFIEMRRLAIIDTDPAEVLRYKTPDQLMEDHPYILSSYDKPVAFTVIGQTIELGPTPDANYGMEVVYRASLTGASTTLVGGANTTNWALAQNPNIYLFGALCESVHYTKDFSALAAWEAKYKEAVNTINNVDWYSGSTPRVVVR